MTKTILTPKDQQLVHSGMTWQQFKLRQESFTNSPGIRLTYYQGESVSADGF